MSIPISHFFSLLREVSIMAVGIQKEKVCVGGVVSLLQMAVEVH